MALRAADARFVLPHPVRRATVLEPRSAWPEALRSAGIEVVAGDDGVDLVVAGPGQAAAAARLGAASVLAAGRAARALAAAGYATTRLFRRSGPAGPRLLVPLDAGPPLRHAVLGRGPGGWRRTRNRAVLAALRAGLTVDDLVLTAGSRTPGPPCFLQAAAAHGVVADGGWALDLGARDDVQRAVWSCFAAGLDQPSWVVKASRVPGLRLPFDADERGLAVLSALPEDLRRHAPRLLGRLEVDGLHGSVETAAPGASLLALLDGPLRGQAALDTVTAVAEWIIGVGAASRGQACSAAALRGELAGTPAAGATAADPAETGTGTVDGLVGAVGAVASVVTHNDLATWNVFVHGSDFTVIDWEFAQASGPPLWDLLYFLTDALSTVARPGDPLGRLDRCLDLLAGKAPGSALLFVTVERAATALGLRPDAVGPLASLCWLHHEARRRRRAERVAASGQDDNVVAPALEPPLHAIASRWFAHPDLGPSWPAYHARAPRR